MQVLKNSVHTSQKTCCTYM